MKEKIENMMEIKEVVETPKEITPQPEWVTQLSEIDANKFSQQERFVRSVLEDYEFEKKTQTIVDWKIVETIEMVKWDPASMLKQVLDDANSAITQNAKWDVIADHKTRAQLKIKILESMWVIKPKQAEIKVNFMSMLFWNKQ